MNELPECGWVRRICVWVTEREVAEKERVETSGYSFHWNSVQKLLMKNSWSSNGKTDGRCCWAGRKLPLQPAASVLTLTKHLRIDGPFKDSAFRVDIRLNSSKLYYVIYSSSWNFFIPKYFLMCLLLISLVSKEKWKYIPVTDRGGLQGYEIWRIPHFLDNLIYKIKIFWTIFKQYTNSSLFHKQIKLTI
jgi:hypothetical protein